MNVGSALDAVKSNPLLKSALKVLSPASLALEVLDGFTKFLGKKKAEKAPPPAAPK